MGVEKHNGTPSVKVYMECESWADEVVVYSRQELATLFQDASKNGSRSGLSLVSMLLFLDNHPPSDTEAAVSKEEALKHLQQADAH